MYDIVFISYNEPNAEENFALLKSRFPLAKRVKNVKGIHQAHLAAAKKAFTKMFWVVDGDARIMDNFNFDYTVSEWDLDVVHIWRSCNPINGLKYGYGGAKLLPRQLTLKMDLSSRDMTTSISSKIKIMPGISNYTAFNTDPFGTWKSAFRECAKLAGRVIDRQVEEETKQRLETWCTVGADKPYGNYAIAGAKLGKQFAETRPDELYKINDFDWLYEQFTANPV